MTESRATEVSPSRRRVPPLVANVLIAGGAVLATVLLCELLLRALGIGYPVYVWTDPVRGVAHIPGVRANGRARGRAGSRSIRTA